MTNIRRLPGLFPAPLAEELRNYIEGAQWKYGWRSNKAMGFAHWNHDLAHAGPDNGKDVSAKLPNVFQRAWNYLKQEHFPDSALVRCYANAHTFGVEGYPHTDSRREADRTVVMYLNHEWKREWGGETLIYGREGIAHAELPRFNSGLLFPSNAWHTARGVTRICPELRLTLMFKFAPNGVDPLRDQLQDFMEEVGAGKKSHSGGTLAGHLLRTYDLLKAAGESRDVCCAGAAHSLFGTNAFRNPCLQRGDDRRLIELIGREAFELVRLFSVVDRPGTLERQDRPLALTEGGTVEVTDKQLTQLSVLEAANLADQRGLKGYPRLHTLWASKELS